MARKDSYVILGVRPGAQLSEIARAYRKVGFSAHPDISDALYAQRFREACDAYETLKEKERRRLRRINVMRAPDCSGHAAAIHSEPRGRPELIRPRRPVNLIDDFATVRPSVGEILDHIAQNFFGFHQKSLGSRRCLGVEVVLDRPEAFFGVSLPIEVPVYARCDRCWGSGGDWGVCASCHGYGLAETSRTVALEIAAGAQTGERYQIDLRSKGIENLVLDVTIVVA
jgi:DnaJ-class molecular chaperone